MKNQSNLIKVEDYKSFSNITVYNLADSCRVNGYPLRTETSKSEENLDRMKRLGNVPIGSGHDCALKGILVTFDWNHSLLINRHIMRYHFIDIIASQSIIHKASSFCIDEHCNGYVTKETIANVNNLISEYYSNQTKENEMKIYYNLPSGFRLTANFTTNYLQLKTMYSQRKNHKLEEWEDFCKFCEKLPYFIEFTQNRKSNT